MEKLTSIVINLKDFKNPSSSNFTGRPQGAEVRKKINLDSTDRSNNTVCFIIPSDTTSFNPSFYLGLLFESFKNLGLEGFNKKYSFIIETTNRETKKVLERNLEDGMRNAINSLHNKNILKEFLSH